MCRIPLICPRGDSDPAASNSKSRNLLQSNPAAVGQNIPSSSDQQQLTEAILAQQETRCRCLVDIEPKME